MLRKKRLNPLDLQMPQTPKYRLHARVLASYFRKGLEYGMEAYGDNRLVP